MPPGKEKKEEGEEPVVLPFQNLEKGLVLQEKRLFNESPLNTKKCATLLTKVLYLLVQGDKLTTTEATDLFFAITKLFQSKDVRVLPRAPNPSLTAAARTDPAPAPRFPHSEGAHAAR